MTMTYLDKIMARKAQAVETLLLHLKRDPLHSLHAMLTSEEKQPTGRFANALTQRHLSVIAEIKRKSPSKGELALILDPVALATQYCRGGAAAISVLTDEESFGGSLLDMTQISHALQQTFSHIPVLRKDFILHPVQLAESALAGASAVLLITHVLKEKLADMITSAHRYGLETLVEVHDEQDLEYALAANATIIGINHRNLTTFEIDMTASKRLFPQIPENVITIAESGVAHPTTAHALRRLGFDAILVGEALVKAHSPEDCLRAMMNEEAY